MFPRVAIDGAAGAGAAESERYGLVVVEVREGCREVAFKARVCRVAVRVGQRGGHCLCVSGDAAAQKVALTAGA